MLRCHLLMGLSAQELGGCLQGVTGEGRAWLGTSLCLLSPLPHLEKIQEVLPSGRDEAHFR